MYEVIMGAILRLDKMPTKCSVCPFAYDDVQRCKLRSSSLISGKTRPNRMPLCPLQNEGKYISALLKSIHRITVKRWFHILELYKYTDKEIEQLVKSIVILTDTREQKNQHILDWLDKKHIPHKTKALSNGDYSFYVPANPDLNIDRDLFFDKEIMVERKGSLEELSGNFSQQRARFEEEMATYPGIKYLLVENANYQDIITGKYDTKFSAKAYLASIHTFNHRYGLQMMFMPDPQYSGYFLYGVFTYFLKQKLR